MLKLIWIFFNASSTCRQEAPTSCRSESSATWPDFHYPFSLLPNPFGVFYLWLTPSLLISVTPFFLVVFCLDSILGPTDSNPVSLYLWSHTGQCSLVLLCRPKSTRGKSVFLNRLWVIPGGCCMKSVTKRYLLLYQTPPCRMKSARETKTGEGSPSAWMTHLLKHIVSGESHRTFSSVCRCSMQKARNKSNQNCLSHFGAAPSLWLISPTNSQQHLNSW